MAVLERRVGKAGFLVEEPPELSFTEALGTGQGGGSGGYERCSGQRGQPEWEADGLALPGCNSAGWASRCSVRDEQLGFALLLVGVMEGFVCLTFYSQEVVKIALSSLHPAPPDGNISLL